MSAPLSIDDRAMEILARKGPMRASELGWELWGENETGGGEGSHRNNKYCRSAGAVLHRLWRLGLVDSDHDRKGNHWYVLPNMVVAPLQQSEEA